MPAYPSSISLFASISGSQVDISSDAIKNPIESEWGINGNKATDILADTGYTTFTLCNRDGKYTPGSTTCMSGWKKGVEISVVIDFDGESYKRFVGTINSIKINDNDYTVDVEILDWINYSATFPLATPEYQTNKTGDEVLTLILSDMPRPPKSTSFDVGIETLPVVFDSTTSQTKAYTEFSKLANSESPGYIYLQHDKTNGEKLVFENRYHRNGLSTLNSYPKTKNNCEQGYVVDDVDNFIISDAGDYITWFTQGYDDAVFQNNMNDISITYSGGMINNITAIAHPKTFDSGSVILYSLAEPIKIGSMQTIEFGGKYVDAYGNHCNVITGSMIQPVATTDFLLNTKKNGTGTNLTASLSGSAIYSTSEVKFIYKNTSAYPGYITKMNCRGIGVHEYTDVTTSACSIDSIQNYDYQNATFNQPYQTDIAAGGEFIQKIIEYEKTPRNKIIDVSFLGNTDEFLLMSYLNCDVGDLIRIIDDRYGVDGLFYIEKIHSTIRLGGIIMLKWTLRQVFTLMLGLSLIGCTFSNSGSTTQDALCYGNLPQLVDLPNMTMSAWIYPNGNAFGDIMSAMVSGEGGFEFSYSVVSGSKIAFKRVYSTGTGIWRTIDTVPSKEWLFVSVTTDSTTNQPVVYVNGVNYPVETLMEASGTLSSIDGMDFCVGNVHGAGSPFDFIYPFDGSIKDARVYNRILTDAEIASLYTGGSVTDGLVFQSPVVRTSELNDYDGVTLTPEMKLLDNIYGAVGTPHGSPITNAIP